MSYKLGLVSLFVRDVPKAQAFYEGFLGMRVVPEFSNADFVFLLPAGGTPIALQNVTTVPQELTGQPVGFELNLEVDDVEAALQAWQAGGITIVSEIADMGAGKYFRARDPEGNSLTVYQFYDQIKAMREQLGM
jgi:catechol 2,3-dioxygenase-like lactoylglutathione lyase family enzyme